LSNYLDKGIELYYVLLVDGKVVGCGGGKFAEKNRPALAELAKKGLPLTTAAGFLSFFSAIPQFPRLFPESYPQAVDNPVYNFYGLWIFCG